MTEQPAERPKKRRRLRWIAVATILLPVWYVGAWLLAIVALERGYLPTAYGNYIAIPFKPLLAYANSELSGADHLKELYCRLNAKEVCEVADVIGKRPRATFQFGPLSPDIPGRLLVDVCDDRVVRATPSPSTEAPRSPDVE
jgi:hypothetical protein